MPAIQRGQAYRIGPNRWGLRYYDQDGNRRRKSPFPSKSAALAHYRDGIEPELRGEPALAPELTLSEFVDTYLVRHAPAVRPRTMDALRWRLGVATKQYGDVPLRDLERMSGELATWQTTLTGCSRFAIMVALRQALGAATRWGYMAHNPAVLAGRNPQPSPRPVRAFTAAELAAIADELSAMYRPLPLFAAATGLRPEEWAALGRTEVDRGARVLTVARTLSGGQIVDLGKTSGSLRRCLCRAGRSTRWTACRRGWTPRLLFPAKGGGLMNLDNFRRREWGPAIEAAGVRRPARIYDMRSTFISNALAAGVSIFEIARIAGTSVRMIEKHYGALLDGAGAGIAGRLDAFDAERERLADRARADS